MGNCSCHPEIETNYLCMKHNVYLCEECLKCRDPEIYCKFRPSCPIWFMDKRQKGLDAEKSAEKEIPRYRVIFQPEGREVAVPDGSTLLEAAQTADVYLNASCNGKGSCGKCKLVIASGNVENKTSPMLTDTEIERNYVLACQSRVKSDVTVRIPEAVLEKRLKVAGTGREATSRFRGLVGEIDPMLKEMPLELAPPTLEDSVSDLDRLNRGLKKKGCDLERLNVGIQVVRQLAEVIREDNGKITASIIQRKCSNEILEVRSGNGKNRPLGLAIDIGTTSIVVYLVDMTDASIIAATSGHNRQAACGDDVINRIVCAEKDGVKKLSRMALATINSLIGEALDSANADSMQVKNIVLLVMQGLMVVQSQV